ncbi:MAG: AEC family transporter [Ruminococcus sp.]|nr:AEC family transporter [Ruminococcus sp.]
MSATILKQTIIMLMLILVGVLCAKTKIISKETNKQLSSFVLQVVNPILILMSFQNDYRPELVRNLLITFGLSVLAFAVMICASFLLVRTKDGRETAIERFASTYSNCAFMGIPLLNALFGTEGVFYLTAFIAVFNFAVWTHGVILISGEKDFKQVVKVLYSPTIIAIVLGIILFFAQIKIPSVPAQALQHIADINTPMAMIVSGVTMSQTNVFNMLKKPRIYYVCLLKLLVIPLILTMILSLFDIDEKVRLTIIVAAAAPPAAMCTLFSIKYGRNSLYSSEIFTVGTILSIITLPIVVKITEKIGCLL